MWRIIFFCGLLSGILHGHEESPKPMAQFSGHGQVKAKADRVVLNITVRSECQLSPKSAQNATDSAVEKIDDFLNSFQDPEDKEFRILVDGGFTTTYSRWHQQREYCRNTFQKQSKIEFRLQSRDDFNSVFSDVQDFVLKHFSREPAIRDSEAPRLFVTIGTPHPELTRDHRIQLERKALNLALIDAKENFKAAISSCEPHRWKVESISESGNSTPIISRRYYAKAAAVSESDSRGGANAPVRFDMITVSKNLNVGFWFEGSLCFEK